MRDLLHRSGFCVVTCGTAIMDLLRTQRITHTFGVKSLKSPGRATLAPQHSSLIPQIRKVPGVSCEFSVQSVVRKDPQPNTKEENLALRTSFLNTKMGSDPEIFFLEQLPT